MKAKCSKCGTALDRIRFVEPGWKDFWPPFTPRRPLCEPCWQRADTREREATMISKEKEHGQAN